MSHELRTPLNSIIGFSSILLNEWVGPLSEEQKKNVATVLRSGNYLLALVNDIIDISKIEAGKFDVNITAFDLKETMEETVEAFKAESQKRGLTIDLKAAEIVVLNDKSRFVQCLNNYISNGLKFTTDGGLKISGKKTRDGKHIEIAVEDTGVGIRKKDLGRLFRPFERIEPGMEEPPPGTGLGLYLTKKITEEILGGEVAVKSKVNSGSRFSLTMAIRNE
jgi:signal transduction histidine kinase